MAAVLFGLDSLYYIGFLFTWGFSADQTVDILFHAWVLFYLISAMVALVRIKKLPPQEEEISAEASETESPPVAEPQEEASESLL